MSRLINTDTTMIYRNAFLMNAQENKRAPKYLQGNSMSTIVTVVDSMEMTTQSASKSLVNVCRKDGFRRYGLMQVWFTRMLLL